MAEHFDETALRYHRGPTPGKLSITPTKPLANQRDLALAYSPGVAAASTAIAEDPAQAASLTIRGNLVGVVTNGTAVLGLGAIGPLAAKPVMEGKAVLFKKFAGIDVFDIEINETDPDRLVEIIAALEPTFGGINLEDIKAPECFIVERKLRERMKIPVFHDDQHGTSIIVGAAVLNGLKVVGKQIDAVKLVCTGAGAAALTCLDLLLSLGLKRENVFVVDIAGVVYAGRQELMDEFKVRYAGKTAARTLDDVIGGADVFLGLSAPGVLKPAMVAKMGERPLILALANPTPEILPEEARAVRPEAVIATGRSDYPNQVNNVLCFPFIFRGALDVGATTINEAMKLAAVRAIADLATAESSDIVVKAYGRDQSFAFGPDYLIPKPFDPRLIVQIAPAVAKAAMDSGVATRPIADLAAYRASLSNFVFRTGFAMRPIFERARANPLRVVYAEGEDERVLRAVQSVVDERLARPILVGRRQSVLNRIARLGLRIALDQDVTLVDPENLPDYADLWRHYHRLMERKGTEPDQARTLIRTNNVIIAAMLLKRGQADAMICGTVGQFARNFARVREIIKLRQGVHRPAALQLLILPHHTLFLADTHVNEDPTAEEIAEMTVMAAAAVRRFGIMPKVALVSHSRFGSSDRPSAVKMREAVKRLKRLAPDLEVEGEMQADAALSEEIRNRVFPDSELKGTANLLIMPTIDAGNIAFNMVKVLGEGLSVGPILLGLDAAAHVVTTAVSTRGLINMTALAVVDAQEHLAGGQAKR
ncbi:MAG TPA: NADP-dependent malic enzyme [Candidatus Sulfotelmatobacter sp.]|nr:NADP-dependent malic enzyme [Candidatus Sulfotelmatobacter sp.]